MVDISSIIEGTVKFRDGKKWKSRWCVMRKLSPVADCLHLQLYRDSKDRYKQGQTKASLSLQHFLGVESGFTLDKESNTIAIICQDVIVVLAFDTRERLIQWQVKISNNLGDDIQYLILVSSAPSKAKLSTGPARMHVQDQRFCLTTGVPPRLAGLWEIGHLRRYGVVDNRFCFEGGSRCGKGEGLYVLVTDQGDEITHTLKLAAQGKLAAKRRPVARKLSAMDSPRKISSARNGDIGTMPEDDGMNGSCVCRTPYWPSQESRDLDSNYGCGDTASVSEIHDCINDIDSFPRTNMTMERCMSCISKLGAPSMSRSSTATGGAATPGTNVPHPAWSIACNDNHQHTINSHQSKQNTGTDRMSLCSHGSSSGNSDYSVPRLATTQGQAGSSESWYERIPSPHLCSNNRASSPCQCCPPRPPKSQAHRPGVTPTNTICNGPKPQMPLPITAPLHIGPYENYDVPRLAPITAEPTNYSENYDTPRRIHECLARDVNCNHTSTGIEKYENYDTPAAVTRNMCGCLPIIATKKENNENMPANCTCHRVMSWADNWIPTLPYCRRGNGIENTGMAGVQINRVKLSGEGKMPVMQPGGDLAIYATVDMSKKLNRRKGCECENNSPNGMDDETSSSSTSNYINIEPAALRQELGIADSNNDNTFKDDTNQDQTNYTNLEFAQSLENYENAKEVLQRAGIQPEDILSPDDYNHVICKKCGHLSAKSHDDLSMDGSAIERDVKRREHGEEQTSKPAEENYMMMEPDSNQRNLQTNFPGYLPMSPAAPVGTVNAAPPAPSPITAPPLPSKTEYLKARMTARLLIGEKSASNPSLIGPPLVDRSRKLRTEGDRVPGSAMMLLHCSGGSPYTRKLLMDNSDLLPAARKRSSSADSSRFLDGGDMDAAEFDSTETLRKSSLNQLTEQRRSSSPCIHQETEPCQEESCYIKANSEVANPTTTETEAEDEISASTNQSQSHSGSQNSHSQSQSQSVNIRRSASVPCKAQNRDSSSSNDSGVSTGSLRQRGGDFADFELPLTTSMSSRRHRHILPPTACVHASLPRRSKSFDPLRELSFQFQRIKIPEKSTSAEAEIPICPPKGKAGFASPGGEATSIAGGPPYIDSRSTSSGTSDMSDYIETLSLSSHSSSDTPEGLRLIRQATTTLRPRSGKEYHNIDRSILCLTQQQQQLTATGAIVQAVDVPIKVMTTGRSSVLSSCPSANYANITPVPENAESPSPGYQSGGSSQDVHHADHFMFKN